MALNSPIGSFLLSHWSSNLPHTHTSSDGYINICLQLFSDWVLTTARVVMQVWIYFVFSPGLLSANLQVPNFQNLRWQSKCFPPTTFSSTHHFHSYFLGPSELHDQTHTQAGGKVHLFMMSKLENRQGLVNPYAVCLREGWKRKEFYSQLSPKQSRDRMSSPKMTFLGLMCC